MPPGIQTITGSPAARVSGVQMLSVRQSSPEPTNSARASAIPGGYATWGDFGPNASASRTPSQRSTDRGGSNRFAPKGGAA
jgi:hypothetical protein